MSKRIVIDPVTRIEGHSKITLHLDDQGRVEDAHFHVTQFRGFEKFCEGRPFAERLVDEHAEEGRHARRDQFTPVEGSGSRVAAHVGSMLVSG